MNRVLKRLWRGVRDESGQSLVVGTISLLAVMPFLALAIDVGQFRYEKRQMQAAVDAAAVAGAIEISSCGSTAACTAMQTAMKSSLAENGVTVGTPLTNCANGSSTTLTLWVNQGPCYLGSTAADPNYGSTSYVEAVLSGPVKTLFASLIGFKTINITVRAEGHTASASSQYCMYVGATSTGAGTNWGITLNGGTVTSSCGVYDDSSSANALESNSGATFTSTKFSVVGGWSRTTEGRSIPRLHR